MRDSQPAASNRSQNHLAAAAARVVAVFGVLILLAGAGALTVGFAGAAPQDLVRLGTIERPPRAVNDDGRIVYVDSDTRVLYYGWGLGQQYFLSEYALGGPRAIPKWKRTTELRKRQDSGDGQPISAQAPYQIFVDHKRQRMGLIDAGDVGGLDPVIRVIDLKNFRENEHWLMPNTLPGFVPSGITYAGGTEDRLYVVGEMSPTALVSDGSATANRKPLGATVVAALRPADFGLIWAKPVPECQQVLNTIHVGSLLARSSRRDVLYFACVTGGAGVGDTFPGQAGLAELHIDPAAASSANAAQFPLEFFPISGSYANGAQSGIAGFDHTSDRFFMQSLSITTPGAWVFDGELQGWAGFITAFNKFDFYAGLNEGNGHYYMGGMIPDYPGRLVIADGRSRPQSAGETFDYRPGGFIHTDSKSNRIFFRGEGPNKEVANFVLDDRTASEDKAAEPDYDAETDDVQLTDETYVNYSASTGGFAAQVLDVGGTRGVLTRLGGFGDNIKPPPKVCDPEETNCVPVTDAMPVGKAGGTRGLVAGRVPVVDARASGAAAGAGIATVDSNTDNELLNDGHSEDDWPFTTPSCLDGGGGVEPQKQQHEHGEARAECDLSHGRAYARSEFQTSDDRLNMSGIFTGTTTATRITESKSMTTTTVRGFTLSTPVGTLVIGDITATAETVAFGRPGKAHATWTRTVTGAEIGDSTGKTMAALPACHTSITAEAGKPLQVQDDGNCAKIVGIVRDLLKVRMSIKFPTPEVKATKKGAFAAIRQTEKDYFQDFAVNDLGVTFALDSTSRRAAPGAEIAVYNDGTERSRVIIQLAAVESSSVYQLSAESPFGDDDPRFDPGDDPVVDPGTSVPDIVPQPVDEDSPPATPPTTQRPRPRPTGLAYGLVVVRRSLGQTIVMAAVLMLFAGAIGSIRRRRRLLASLDS